MSTPVSRKSFLTALGAAGVGAGLLRFATPAAAQDTDDDSRDEPEGGGQDGMMEAGDWREGRTQVYADFTEALATELGNTTADEVDAAIRKAIIALIDIHVSDDELTSGQAEALKVIVATTDVPITPAFMGTGIGPGPGMGMGMMPGGMMPGGHGGRRGSGRGHMRHRGRMGERHQGHTGHRHGDMPMVPDAPAAPSAPDQAVPVAPDAPATPQAGA